MLFLTIFGLWLLSCFFSLIFCALELIILARKYKVESIEELYEKHSDSIFGCNLKETIVIHIAFAPILLIAYAISGPLHLIVYTGIFIYKLFYNLFFNNLWGYVTAKIYKFVGYFIEKYGIKNK